MDNFRSTSYSDSHEEKNTQVAPDRCLEDSQISNIFKSEEVSYQVSEIQRMLLPHHLRALREERGIRDEVIAARGCRSITNRQELSRYGFKPYKATWSHIVRPQFLFPFMPPTVVCHISSTGRMRRVPERASRNSTMMAHRKKNRSSMKLQKA